MIARIWKGAVRREDGDAYAEYMQATGIAGYTRTSGNRTVDHYEVHTAVGLGAGAPGPREAG